MANPINTFAFWAKNIATGMCDYVSLPGISTIPGNQLVADEDGNLLVPMVQEPPQGGVTVAPSQPAESVDVVFTVNSDPSCSSTQPRAVTWELFEDGNPTAVETGSNAAGTVTLPDLSSYTSPFTVVATPIDGCGQGAVVSAAFDVFDPGVITPTVSVDVASGQEANAVTGTLTYIRHPNCTDTAAPNIVWELYETGNASPIADGTAVATTGVTLPDLTNNTQPFRLEATVTDGCGVSNLAFASFTVAEAALDGGTAISVDNGVINFDCEKLNEEVIDPSTHLGVFCGPGGPVKGRPSGYVLLPQSVLEVSDASITAGTIETATLASVPAGALAHLILHIGNVSAADDELYISVFATDGGQPASFGGFTHGIDGSRFAFPASQVAPQRLIWEQWVKVDDLQQINYVIGRAGAGQIFEIAVLGYIA